MEIKAGATVEIKPLGGQIIPFALIIVAAALFLIAVWLDAQGKPYYLSVTGACVCLFTGVGLYLLSRRDSDLQKAHPFGMTLGSGSNQVAITADSRSLPALDYLKGILTYWSGLLEREPLPEASGMVDENGNPVPNSKASASEIVKAANEAAQDQIEEVSQQIVASQAAGARHAPEVEKSTDSLNSAPRP